MKAPPVTCQAEDTLKPLLPCTTQIWALEFCLLRPDLPLFRLAECRPGAPSAGYSATASSAGLGDGTSPSCRSLLLLCGGLFIHFTDEDWKPFAPESAAHFHSNGTYWKISREWKLEEGLWISVELKWFFFFLLFVRRCLAVSREKQFYAPLILNINGSGELLSLTQHPWKLFCLPVRVIPIVFLLLLCRKWSFEMEFFF